MAELTGGQAIVEALRAEGVDTVFGLIGSATMELLDALYDAEDIRYVGVRDERTGTHMADGYARSSGRPGVMIAGQNGPGTTNLVTGLAQALRAYSPVVTIGGAAATNHHNLDGFQEIDQQALFTPITKRTYSAVRTDRLGDLLRQAFREALAPRPGPVHLNVPRDVLAGTAAFAEFPPAARYRATRPPAADPALVDRAAELLRAAQRPVLLAGGGIKAGGRWQETIALAERLGCPVAASAGHGDAVPGDHELAAGQMGPRGNPVATRLLREADVILVLGSRLGFNSTFFSSDNLNPDATLLQVELEPSALGRYFPVDLAIVGDAPGVAGALLARLDGHRPGEATRAWTAAFQRERAQLWAEREEAAQADTAPLQPARVWAALRRVLPHDVMLTLDAGTLCLQAHDLLPYRQPPCLFTPLDFGLVGFSFAAGLGIKLANPGRPVVSLMGDGGFGMTMSELATAVTEGIDTTTLVLNNHVWGAEKAYQRDFYGGRYIGSDLRNPPYDEVARLFGAAGFRVEKAQELEDVVAAAIATEGPAVVDIQVDPDALYSFRRDSFTHRSAGTTR
jgi:acetolactate synthase-1/2/3 large subunit/sulfoacetaldehyde acetyltransferase